MLYFCPWRNITSVLVSVGNIEMSSCKLSLITEVGQWLTHVNTFITQCHPSVVQPAELLLLQIKFLDSHVTNLSHNLIYMGISGKWGGLLVSGGLQCA